MILDSTVFRRFFMYVNQHFGIFEIEDMICFLIIFDQTFIYVWSFKIFSVLVNWFINTASFTNIFFITIRTRNFIHSCCRFYVNIVIFIINQIPNCLWRVSDCFHSKVVQFLFFRFFDVCSWIVDLVWLHGISTTVGYLMSNPVFIYVLNIWFINIFWRYTHLNDHIVLFLTIQFSISHLFTLSLNVKQSLFYP